jgi:chromosome partition protein MukF
VFERVLAICEPEAQNPRKIATHALQRLRDQRLLGRVDGAGLYRPGEFAMTRLAVALVDFFVTDEVLTREPGDPDPSAGLPARRDALRRALGRGDEGWRQVVQHLGVAVGDLVAGIERRQRGLDQQQEKIRADIAELLGRSWFEAVQDCERLLVEMATTLQELARVLLQDVHLLQAQLQELELLAETAGASHAASEARKVSEQIERVLAVAQARQEAWSEYYQYVHRYLRDVVRLDPDRQTSQRLRDQLVAWPDEPFSLVVLAPDPIYLLRAQEAAIVRPPVRRKRAEVETPIEVLSPLDPHVTALEGDNAAGKTTVMIGAYIVLPDLRKLRFTNLGETAASGGDHGIYGRLGRPGPSYTALDLRLPDRAGTRIVAAVLLLRRARPILELKMFVIEHLSAEVPLSAILLDRHDEEDEIPELVLRIGSPLRVVPGHIGEDPAVLLEECVDQLGAGRPQACVAPLTPVVGDLQGPQGGGVADEAGMPHRVGLRAGLDEQRRTVLADAQELTGQRLMRPEVAEPLGRLLLRLAPALLCRFRLGIGTLTGDADDSEARVERHTRFAARPRLIVEHLQPRARLEARLELAHRAVGLTGEPCHLRRRKPTLHVQQRAGAQHMRVRGRRRAADPDQRGAQLRREDERARLRTRHASPDHTAGSPDQPGSNLRVEVLAPPDADLLSPSACPALDFLDCRSPRQGAFPHRSTPLQDPPQAIADRPMEVENAVSLDLVVRPHPEVDDRAVAISQKQVEVSRSAGPIGW